MTDDSQTSSQTSHQQSNDSDTENQGCHQSNADAASQDSSKESDTTASHENDNLEKLENDLSQARNEIENMKNLYARTMADLENYKKRVEKEKFDFIRSAGADFLRMFLPCIDNLKRTNQFIPESVRTEEWCKGLTQTINLFDETLKKIGVEEIKTIGEKADHNFHEALMNGPGEEGIIIEEFEKGYILNGQVIRFAKVKVGNGEGEKGEGRRE